MFFIWGFGSARKYTNVYVKETCDKCGTTQNINIIMDYNYGSLFFIQIVKARKKYYIVCPNCGAFKQISKREFKEIKSSNKNGLIYKTSDVVVTNEPVKAIEQKEVQKNQASEDSKQDVQNVKINETSKQDIQNVDIIKNSNEQIEKNQILKEIEQIINKLKERNYVVTTEKLPKFKPVLKEQLLKKFNNEQLVDSSIEEYFNN